MNTQFILLWLEGPLQSWGFDSKFDRRDTLQFPTKSGILGLVCSALGASGEQKEFLAEMANLRQSVLAFSRSEKNAGLIPFLRDFQMIGSGYNENDPWEKLLKLKKNDGGSPTNNPGTKLTYRYYLQDACFAVALEVPSGKVQDISDALQSPVYDVYLGRKSCKPTDIIFRGVFATLEKAEERALCIANEPEKNMVLKFKVIDGEHDGETMTLNDVPIRFGPIKKYRDRQVTVITV